MPARSPAHLAAAMTAAFVAPIAARPIAASSRHLSTASGLHGRVSTGTARAPALAPAPALNPRGAEDGGYGAGFAARVAVVWVRDDLRVHDNPALVAGCAEGRACVPVVVSTAGRDRFWGEAVAGFRESVRALGGEVYVRDVPRGGDTAGVLRDFCEQAGAGECFYHMGKGTEAQREEAEVSRVLEAAGVRCAAFWANTLVTPKQLPCGIQDLPEDCDVFGRMVKDVAISEPVAPPAAIVPLRVPIEAGNLPQFDDGPKRDCGVRGGERAALERLQDYVAGKSLVSVNGSGSVGVIDTKFGRLGPFLSTGCLSPRRLYHEVMKGVNENSVRRYCAEFELVLRDFFFFLTLKHGVNPL